MAAVIKYLDPTTQQYIQIPLRPTADVLSVNGKNGIVDLASTDILMSDGTTTVQAAIDKKLVAPTTAGTAGQFLALDTDGVSTVWKTGGSISAVSSVNGLTGDVVLNSQNVKMADNTTIEDTVNGKITNPTTGTAGQVLTKTATGVEWATAASAPVTSVNTLTGDVVLTTANVKNADGSKTAQELIDAKFDEPSGTKSTGTAVVYDGSAVNWKAIPLQINGMTGNVTLYGTDIKMSTTDTTTLTAAISDKLVAPTAGTGTTGQILAKTATGTEWINAPSGAVTSVQGLTGDVVLTADNVKNTAGTYTVQQLIDQKLELPTGTRGNAMAPVQYSGSFSWRSIPLKVNGKAGIVTLTGEDIAVSTTNTTKLSNAVLGGKINGTALTVTDNYLIIPLAGTSTTNAAGSYGVVNVNKTNGIEVDSSGTLQFNSLALNAIGAAYKAINAAEYNETTLYQVGQYCTYEGRFYVCKTSNTTGLFSTANWKETNETDEVNNMLAQLISALGIKEGLRRWDSTNNKVIYDFDLDN